MFSSTHFRSSSWKRNTELETTAQYSKTNRGTKRDATKCWTYFFAQQFLGAIRIWLWAPHLHPLYRTNNNCDMTANVCNTCDDNSGVDPWTSFSEVVLSERRPNALPKASFSMGSLASSSSSSSIRGEWENLRRRNRHWNFDLKCEK